jgi:hypothetical protein
MMMMLLLLLLMFNVQKSSQAFPDIGHLAHHVPSTDKNLESCFADRGSWWGGRQGLCRLASFPSLAVLGIDLLRRVIAVMVLV